MKTIEVTVANPKDELSSVLDIAAQVDAGEVLEEAVPILTFPSLRRLFSAITDRRLELIRYVVDHEDLNTRQLSKALSRDYKNVYEDVQMLCEYGLLEKDDGALSAPYDHISIRSDIDLYSAA